MNYRQANSSDIHKLKELEQAVVEAERPFNPNIKPGKVHYYDLEDLLSSEDAYLLVAEDNGSIVATGYAKIQASKAALNHQKHAYLGFMFVSPDYRGKGINREIINQLIQWGRSRQVFDFYLDVYAENIAAIKAYEKVGFTPSLVEMQLSL